MKYLLIAILLFSACKQQECICELPDEDPIPQDIIEGKWTHERYDTLGNDVLLYSLSYEFFNDRTGIHYFDYRNVNDLDQPGYMPNAQPIVWQKLNDRYFINYQNSFVLTDENNFFFRSVNFTRTDKFFWE